MVKILVYPSRKTYLAKKYTTCPKYPRHEAHMTLKLMKKNMSELEETLTLRIKLKAYFMLKK